MKIRKNTRLLISIALTLTVGMAIGVEAQAATRRASFGVPGAYQSGGNLSAPKPGASPMIGEPDVPPGVPLPPKDGTYPTGGGGFSYWLQRVIDMLWSWTKVPNRLP